MLEGVSNFFELITKLLSGDAPLWLYALILFIPFCVLIAVREAYCWFNKVNAVVSRLDKIDRTMKDLKNAIIDLSDLLAKSQIKVATDTNKKELQNLKSHEKKIDPEPEKQEKFYLDRDWTNK